MQHFNKLFTPLAAGMIAIVVHRCLESVLVFNISVPCETEHTA